jgi:hypothetical protein
MKPRTFTLTAIAFSLLLGIATIQAQTPKALASIPFDFQVGAQHMSAGRYAVETSDGYLLNIRGLNTPDSAYVLAYSIGSRQSEKQSPRLVFFRFGNQYYLAQVWSPDLQDGRKISLPTNRQMEASNGGSNQESTFAFARH